MYRKLYILLLYFLAERKLNLKNFLNFIQ